VIFVPDTIPQDRRPELEGAVVAAGLETDSAYKVGFEWAGMEAVQLLDDEARLALRHQLQRCIQRGTERYG
jgi:hypothetical protein